MDPDLTTAPRAPGPLGALAYLEALLLLGIAVTGLIPCDAGYNWLSLAAGAVVGPVLSVRLGTALRQPETPSSRSRTDKDGRLAR